MSTKFFTVDEANALLSEIKPLMAQLLERRAKVVASRDDLSEILTGNTSDVGGPEASKLVQEFIIIQRLANQIKSYGCIIKNLNAGLVDFLSIRDGREVYLCWRYGESDVSHFHELHTGFMGREHI